MLSWVIWLFSAKTFIMHWTLLYRAINKGYTEAAPLPSPLVSWLDEDLKVKDQGGDSGSLNLILLKKYYSTNTDLTLLASSSVLLRNLYSQVLLVYNLR